MENEHNLNLILNEIEALGIQDVQFTKCLGTWMCEAAHGNDHGFGDGKTRPEAARRFRDELRRQRGQHVERI